MALSCGRASDGGAIGFTAFDFVVDGGRVVVPVAAKQRLPDPGVTRAAFVLRHLDADTLDPLATQVSTIAREEPSDPLPDLVRHPLGGSASRMHHTLAYRGEPLCCRPQAWVLRTRADGSFAREPSPLSARATQFVTALGAPGEPGLEAVVTLVGAASTGLPVTWARLDGDGRATPIEHDALPREVERTQQSMTTGLHLERDGAGFRAYYSSPSRDLHELRFLPDGRIEHRLVETVPFNLERVRDQGTPDGWCLYEPATGRVACAESLDAALARVGVVVPLLRPFGAVRILGAVRGRLWAREEEAPPGESRLVHVDFAAGRASAIPVAAVARGISSRIALSGDDLLVVYGAGAYAPELGGERLRITRVRPSGEVIDAPLLGPEDVEDALGPP